jgi:hypothetical protein
LYFSSPNEIRVSVSQGTYRKLQYNRAIYGYILLQDSALVLEGTKETRQEDMKEVSQERREMEYTNKEKNKEERQTIKKGGGKEARNEGSKSGKKGDGSTQIKKRTKKKGR